jgi:hypothetical protein
VHAADVLLTFEGSDSEYLRSYSAPAWVAHYSPNHFWHVIYGAPTVAAMAHAIKLVQQRGAGRPHRTIDRLTAEPLQTEPRTDDSGVLK